MALVVVAERLRDPLGRAGPNCLIEALALDAIIEDARDAMMGDGHSPSQEFDEIHEYLFDDTDYLFMFDPSFDGIDEHPHTGMEPLRCNSWGLGHYGRRVHPMYETPEPPRPD